jgi:hypothetical protein
MNFTAEQLSFEVAEFLKVLTSIPISASEKRDSDWKSSLYP